MRPIRTLVISLAVLLALPVAAQASSLKLVGGVLTYTDSVATNANVVVIALSPDGSRITVTESGRTARNRAITISGDGSCLASGSAGSCTASSVSSISVDTGGGNDSVSQGAPRPSKLSGGAGDDSLIGGPGDDVFPQEPGRDTVSGGGGRDTADYSKATAAVTVSLDGQPNDGAASEGDNINPDVEVVIGGSGNDALAGSDADNALLGGAGDDILGGGGGNDSLDGGPGADQLAGAAGDDTLDGGSGPDVLSGGDGTDTATYANSGAGVRVTLDGKPGDGEPGENDNVDSENVTGSGHDDVLVGNAGANVLIGGAGNDRILGGDGVDALDLGPGDDIAQALDGKKETISCGDGEDGVVTDRGDVRVDCDYIKYRPLAASSTALHLSQGAVRVPVRCSPATVDGCRGRIALRIGKRTIGSLSYKLAPGRRWVARVKLTRTGVRTVRRHRVTTASMHVRDSDPSGDAVTTRQTIRIAR